MVGTKTWKEFAGELQWVAALRGCEWICKFLKEGGEIYRERRLTDLGFAK